MTPDTPADGEALASSESVFMDAVWDALKADANDLRKQQRILRAFRAALIPRPAEPAQAAQDEDPICTGCDGTGVSHQTERFCECDTGRSARAFDALEQLTAIRALLIAGQGDDDGPQILPDFEPDDSVEAMVEACLHLLEKRRDVIAADAQAARVDLVAKLPRLTEAMIIAACKAHYGSKIVDQLGIDGIDLATEAREYTFRDGFKRMWSGVRAVLRANATDASEGEP